MPSSVVNATPKLTIVFNKLSRSAFRTDANRIVDLRPFDYAKPENSTSRGELQTMTTSASYPTSRDARRFRRTTGRLLVFGLLFLFAATGDANFAASATEDTNDVEVQFGFRGHAKLGSWVPMLVKTPDRLEPRKFKLKLVDGDDLPITYIGDLLPVGVELNQHQGFAKIGRGYGSAQLTLLDVHDNSVYTETFPLAKAGVVHASTRRMILALEPEGRLRETIESNAVFRAGETSEIVVSIDEPSQLPLDWFCYQGVDTIFLVTSDPKLAKNITEAQWLALERWIENGGRLIFSVATEGVNLIGKGAPWNDFVRVSTGIPSR